MYTAPRDQGYQSCLNSIHQSLEFLQTSYLDLYLIHWPGAGGKKVDDSENAKLRQESWKAMEECYKKGTLRAIGVSNYTIRHLEEMKSYSSILPHVLQVILKNILMVRLYRFTNFVQVEHHPHYNQVELMDYCQKNGIHYQAYSSLGTTVNEESNPLLNDPVVQDVARKYQKSAAQLLLRWSTQQGIG